MNRVAIKAENLGKLYHIGAQQERYRTLRDAMLTGIKQMTHPRKTRPEDTIWALKGVDFEVLHGEVVGIIGRNGAGKSTLLKILSHITEPTEGRVTLWGRVGSLLEVGTGFHPELTGRENIYLNGAILGMKKNEVDRKFDQIAAFSEIEQFLDTPVKRYSSGMYVRLAFSVAAHMEPEILLIDEVLSVGDAGFQKKCLGKMEEVAGRGRTVLFVSHNLVAVRSLCEKAILIDSGRIIANGDTDSVVNQYMLLTNARETDDFRIHSNEQAREGNGAVVFREWWIEDDIFGTSRQARSCQSCSFQMLYETKSGNPIGNVAVTLTIKNNYGQPVITGATWFTDSDFRTIPSKGIFSCHFNSLPLAPGKYSIHLYCNAQNEATERIPNAGSFDVIAEDVFGTGRMLNDDHGDVIVTDFSWSVKEN